MKKRCATAAVLLSLLFMTILPVSSIAADRNELVSPQDNGYYTWEITDSELLYTTTLDAEYTYYATSEPATAGGREAMSATYSEKATASADLEVTIKEAVVSVGLTYETSYSISGTRISRTLQDGERVSLFTVTRYAVYRVKQEHGYKLHSDFYTDGTVKYALVYVPQSIPGLHLCYHYGTTPQCTHTPE